MEILLLEAFFQQKLFQGKTFSEKKTNTLSKGANILPTYISSNGFYRGLCQTFVNF